MSQKSIHLCPIKPSDSFSEFKILLEKHYTQERWGCTASHLYVQSYKIAKKR